MPIKSRRPYQNVRLTKFVKLMKFEKYLDCQIIQERTFHSGHRGGNKAKIDFEFLAPLTSFGYNFRGKDQKMWFFCHFDMKNVQFLMIGRVKISIWA